MGGISSAIAIGRVSYPTMLRMYLSRGIILTIFGVIVFCEPWFYGVYEYGILFNLMGLMTIATGLIMIGVSRNGNPTIALSAFIVFCIRSVLYAIFKLIEIAAFAKYAGGFLWIFLILSILVSVAYLYFTYVGWQRCKAYAANGGSAYGNVGAPAGGYVAGKPVAYAAPVAPPQQGTQPYYANQSALPPPQAAPV